jgi:geranylgeranyl reductase
LEAHPINCDYRGHHFGNVFLAGDAAGVTSGFSGEGIYQALIFGDEIADLIIDSSHKSEKIDEVLREKRIHEMMLFLVMLSGPFRNGIFYLVIFAVRIPWCGRILLRIMS